MKCDNVQPTEREKWEDCRTDLIKQEDFGCQKHHDFVTEAESQEVCVIFGNTFCLWLLLLISLSVLSLCVVLSGRVI